RSTYGHHGPLISKRWSRATSRWPGFLCRLYQARFGPAHSQKMTSAHSSSCVLIAASCSASFDQRSIRTSNPGELSSQSTISPKNFRSWDATSTLVGAAPRAGVRRAEPRRKAVRKRSVARESEYAPTRAVAVRDTSSSTGIPSRSAIAAERRSSWQKSGYCSPHTVRFDIDAFSSGGVPAAEYSSAFVESSRLLSSV